jgi:osmotically-inducible protein OsmY
MRVWNFLLLGLMVGLVLSFNGCTSVAGSVASSGAQALYNHHSLSKSANDQYITLRSYQAIDIDSDHFRNANINVSTFNRVVLLSGQVPDASQKVEAEQLVRKISGIEQIYNLITVEKPTSQLARLNDVWITTKVKAKLLTAADLDAAQIKVVTENSRVFLMGILRPKEARVAVAAASRTAGVHEVVKIFSYLNLSKTPAEDG